MEKKLQNIKKIARKMGIKKQNLHVLGENMAKVDLVEGQKNGKLVLVTAMTSNKTFRLDLLMH